jgi:hypothetical protein
MNIMIRRAVSLHRTTWLGNPDFAVLIGVALSVGLVSGCAAPFSDLQSARLAGPNRVEVTPSYSAVSSSDEGERESVQDHFGVQVATGVSDRVDLRARYERINLKDDDSGVNVLGFGPKFGLVGDRLAFYVPVGFAFGEGIEVSETFQVHPTLLLTVPVHESIELNGSVKALIPITERDIDDLIAFNFGVGLGPDLRRWVIRPEIGFLFNPGEGGHFRHLSIGLTYYFDR